MSCHHQQETFRYVAPECITVRGGTLRLGGHSKESDVYSLAMTFFSVCPLLETVLLLDTIVSLSSGPHRGIAVSRNQCQGHAH